MSPPHLGLIRALTLRLQGLAQLQAGENHAFADDALLLRTRDALIEALLALPDGLAHLAAREPARFLRKDGRMFRMRRPAEPDWIARIALDPADPPPVFQRKLTAGLLIAPIYDLLPEPERIPHATYLSLPGDLLNQFAPEPGQMRSAAHQARYTGYLTGLFTALDRLVAAHGARGAIAARSAIASVNLNPLFSIPGSGRALREAFGRLMTRIAALLHPPFAGRGQPRRIALYWRDLVDRTENYAGAAVLEDLAGAFEVHSFVYAAGHVRQTGEGGRVASLARDLSASVTSLTGMSGNERLAAMRAADCALALPVSNAVHGANGYIYDLAARIAPRQAAFYTSPLTTGLPAMDDWISGTASEGPDAQDHFSERLRLIEGSIIKFRGVDPPSLRRRAASRLRARLGEGPVFAAGGSVYKFSPEQAALWGRLLRARPAARLLLYPFNPNWGAFYSLEAMAGALRAADPEFPLDRLIVLGPRQHFGDIAALIAACDLYLDTWPHSGGFSTYDGLIAGLPVVTLEGEWQRARQGADVLRQMGLDRYIANNPDALLQLACALVDDPARYAAARRDVEAALTRSRLFEGYGGAFRAAVQEIIDRDPA